MNRPKVCPQCGEYITNEKTLCPSSWKEPFSKEEIDKIPTEKDRRYTVYRLSPKAGKLLSGLGPEQLKKTA